MERKEFLKKLGLASMIVPMLTQCKDDDNDAVTPDTTGTSTTGTHTTTAR